MAQRKQEIDERKGRATFGVILETKVKTGRFRMDVKAAMNRNGGHISVNFGHIAEITGNGNDAGAEHQEEVTSEENIGGVNW